MLKKTLLSELQFGDTFLYQPSPTLLAVESQYTPAWVIAYPYKFEPIVLAYIFGKMDMNTGVFDSIPNVGSDVVSTSTTGLRLPLSTEVIKISDFHEYKTLRDFLTTYLDVVLKITKDIFGADKVFYSSEDPLVISAKVLYGADIEKILALESEWIKAIVQLNIPSTGPSFALDLG